MAKLTWIGEDDLHNGGAGPSFTTAFGGIKFPKGEAVEVSDEAIVAKARNNQYFKVSGDDAPAKPEEAHEDDLDGLKVAELREMAEARGLDHDGMTKAELREALK